MSKESLFNRIKINILINITQLFCQLWFGLYKKEVTYADESTSAFVWRTKKTSWIKWINWIFKDPTHCEQAYISELSGIQNAPEYHK